MRNAAICLVLFCLLAIAPARAQQAPSGPVAFPDALFFVSAPDLAKSWPNLEATPLYAAVKSMGAMPDFTQMETEIGFSASPANLFATVISGAAVSIAPGLGESEGAALLISLQLSDVEKFDKLFKLYATRENQAATQPVFTEESVSGASVWVIDGLFENVPLYATRKDTSWVASNVRQVVDQFAAGEGAFASAPLSSQMALQKLTKVQPDLKYSFEVQQLTQLLQGAQSLNPLMSTAGVQRMAGVIGITPNEVTIESSMEFDPAAISAMPKMPPDALSGLAYVPQSTGLLSVKNNGSLVEQMKQARQALTANPQMGAMAAQSFASMDSMFGMSFENELLPAFGGNAFFALNDLKILATPPYLASIDLVMGVEAKDREKIGRALTSFENMVQMWANMSAAAAAGKNPNAKNPNAAAAAAGPTPSPAPGLPAATPVPTPAVPQMVLSMNHRGVDVRTFNLSSMGLPISPSYCIDEKFLLIGLTKDSLIRALEIKGGSQPSFANSEAAKQLGSRFGQTDHNQVTYVDFRALTPAASQLKTLGAANMQAAGSYAQIGMDLLGQIANSLKYAITSSRMNGAEMHTVGILALNK